MEARRLKDYTPEELRRMMASPIQTVREARTRLAVLRAFVTAKGELYGAGSNRKCTMPPHYLSEISDALEGTAYAVIAKRIISYVGTRFQVSLSTGVLTAWMYEMDEAIEAVSAVFRPAVFADGVKPDINTQPVRRKGVKLDSLGRPLNRVGVPIIP